MYTHEKSLVINFVQALVVELEGMMKAAHEKGLEEMEDKAGGEVGEGEGEGKGEEEEKEGEGVGEGVGEGSKEGEGEGETQRRRQGREGMGKGKEREEEGEEGKENNFHVPTRTQRSSKRQTKTPAGGKSAKSKLKTRLKAPLVEWNSDDDVTGALEWSDDSDFKIDVLSSARKATIISSGSNQKRKSVKQRKKIRPLVYSSDEGNSTEEGEGKEGGTDFRRNTQKIPSRFAFSDEDD